MKYRGINYTIEKQPIYGKPHQFSWSGQILFPGKPQSINGFGSKSRTQIINIIKIGIERYFERLNTGCDDVEMLDMARPLLLHATNYKHHERVLRAFQEQHQPKGMTKDELHDVIDRVCDLAKQLIEVQHEKVVDRPGLVAKLRKMTVENGSTPEEAATAKEKLRQLGS